MYYVLLLEGRVSFPGIAAKEQVDFYKNMKV